MAGGIPNEFGQGQGLGQGTTSMSLCGKLPRGESGAMELLTGLPKVYGPKSDPGDSVKRQFKKLIGSAAA